MKNGLMNLIAGAATVLQIAPVPARRRFGEKFLDHPGEDDLKCDIERVIGDVQVAVGKVLEADRNAETRSQARAYETTVPTTVPAVA